MKKKKARTTHEIIKKLGECREMANCVASAAIILEEPTRAALWGKIAAAFSMAEVELANLYQEMTLPVVKECANAAARVRPPVRSRKYNASYREGFQDGRDLSIAAIRKIYPYYKDEG